MKKKISRISLIVYVILFVLAWFLLSTEGGYVVWFLIMGLFSIPPIVAGPKNYRILGSIAFAVALAAAAFDYHAGKRLHAKLQKLREQVEIRQKTEANKSPQGNSQKLAP